MMLKVSKGDKTVDAEFIRNIPGHREPTADELSYFKLHERKQMKYVAKVHRYVVKIDSDFLVVVMNGKFKVEIA